MNLPIITSMLKIVPVLGIKIYRKSMLNVSKIKVAAMYSSGALASMLCPLIPYAYSLKYLDHLTTIFISILTFGNIAFTIYFSSKVGDFSKALKILHLE